jgi:uncharacterized protein YegL
MPKKRSGSDAWQRPRGQEERSILVNFVLDASGSMMSIQNATISGFNEFLGDQQREGGRAMMTLTLFNTSFNTVATAVPVKEMLPLTQQTYSPNGMTALYDAIGHTMSMTDDFVARHKPDQVLFVVMTDGHENSSRQYDQRRIFDLIAERQAEAGYEFIYLGANQDSYAVGTAMGVKGDRTLTYVADEAGAADTMKRVSKNVSAYRRFGGEQMADGMFFSKSFEDVGAVDYEEHKRKQAGGDSSGGKAQDGNG